MSTGSPEPDRERQEPESVPERNPEDFNVKAFQDDLKGLHSKLQSDRFKDLDADFPGDDLAEMVTSVSGVMDDFKAYSNFTAKQLDDVRGIMYDIKDRVYRKIHSRPYEPRNPTLLVNGSTTNPKTDGRVSLEEREIEAKIQTLNKELAKVGDELLRSSQLVLETESSAAEATLIAEKTAQEAKRTQEEYEKRKKEEHEKKQKEEADRLEKERKLQEEMERKEEERKKEDARRGRLMKNPSVQDGLEPKAAAWESWPSFEYMVEGPVGKEVGCMVRADPQRFSEGALKCSTVPQIDVDFKYELNEELVGNIIRLAYSNEDELINSPIQVAIPHCISRASAASREAVIKARQDDGSWKDLASNEVTFEGCKDMKFAQAELSVPTDLAVVSRFKRDFLVLGKRGGKVTSNVDTRVTFSTTKNTFKKNEHFVFQLQPVDSATMNAIKQLPEGKGLLTSSSIAAMEWESREFDGPVTMTLPVPPNPVKAKKAAAARAAKEAKMKQPVGFPPPMADAAPSGNPKKKKQTKQKSQQKQEDDEEDAEPVKKVNTTKWYMGQYGNSDDDENDLLYFVQKLSNGKWQVKENFGLDQIKLDIVQMDLFNPYPKFIVLRTRTNLDGREAQKIAELIEERLSQRIVQSILKQRADDLCDICMQIVPVAKQEKTIKALEDEGYEEGPGAGKEVSLHEGDVLEVTFRGNIKSYDNKKREIIFNSQLTNRASFSVVEVDKYLQKNYQVYRGFVQLERVETVTHKAKRNDDGTEEEPLVEVVRHLVSDHLVSIPKDSEQPCTLNRVQPVLVQTDGPINEQFLRNLSANLGDEWQKLAHYLNVKKVRLQAIIRDANSRNQGNDETCKYEMLMTWVKKVPRGINKVEILQSALSKSCREDLAAELADLDKELRSSPPSHTTAASVQ
ncbi:hypothetical protein CAPTEDRAFT_228009 [Capitella teleta]|uniref:Death domain-containing protein n=1 Tax=Capitella teleta TaxID=283909 RepID=R7VC42_CAPTE|nr:hypothetical protein CAPTEDRAFT_228009 [Capitella teleta]|eukprot:ELU16132.1 hypothetical protein CAPTEDRAFT_228009 [Capitella teleta]